MLWYLTNRVHNLEALHACCSVWDPLCKELPVLNLFFWTWPRNMSWCVLSPLHGWWASESAAQPASHFLYVEVNTYLQHSSSHSVQRAFDNALVELCQAYIALLTGRVDGEVGWEEWGAQLSTSSLSFDCVAWGVILWGQLKRSLQWREMSKCGEVDNQQLGMNIITEEHRWTGLSKGKRNG